MLQRWTDPQGYWTKRLRKIQQRALSGDLDRLSILARFRRIENYADKSPHADKMKEVRSLLEKLMFETIDDQHVRDTFAYDPVVYYARRFGIPTPIMDNADKLCRVLLLGHIRRCKDHFRSFEFPAVSIQTLRILNNDLAMPLVRPVLEDLKCAVILATKRLSRGLKATKSYEDGVLVYTEGDECLNPLKRSAQVLATIGNASDIPEILSLLRSGSNVVSVTEEQAWRNQTYTEISPIHSELKTLVEKIVKSGR